MKKIVSLNENDLYKMLSLIIEEIDFDAYDDSDFFDAFLIVFKEWISKKLNDDIRKYPISFLLKKYGKEFEKEMGISDNEDEEDDDYDYDEDSEDYDDYDRWRIISTAKNLIKKGKHTLPTLNTNTKFTDRYKKSLPLVVEHLNLPEYVNFSFEEEIPNKVNLNISIDYTKYITDTNTSRINGSNIFREVKNFLKNFMGVEFGNPSYGKVDIGLDTVSFKGQEEWVKNILNKKIKKDIKQLPNANILHSIRFSVTPNSGVSDLKLIFKDSYFSRGSWETKRNFKTSVESYLENNGYNTNIIRVKG